MFLTGVLSPLELGSAPPRDPFTNRTLLISLIGTEELLSFSLFSCNIVIIQKGVTTTIKREEQKQLNNLLPLPIEIFIVINEK